MSVLCLVYLGLDTMYSMCMCTCSWSTKTQILSIVDMHIPYCLELRPGAFISFKQLFTPATKRDRRLYETGIYLISIHESTSYLGVVLS